MPRHKTAHRKAQEKRFKKQTAARAELLKAAKNDPTLKPNAAAAAKRFKG